MDNILNDLMEVIQTWKSFREEYPKGTLNDFAWWLTRKKKNDNDKAGKYVMEETAKVNKKTKASDLSNRAMIGYLLGRMNMFVKNYAKEPFQELGVSSMEEFRLLALTDRLVNPNKSELSHAAMMEFSTVNDMLKRLEKRGLIAQQKDKEDKRASRLFLTAKGKTLLKSIFETLSVMEPKVTGDLSANEQQKLIELLMRLNHFHTHYFENVFGKKK